jgi:UDP-N-acetylmuramyl pentapeptide synthase
MEFASGRILLASAVCLAVLILYYIGEKIVLAKWRRAVPLRICVTGTRGKSTVTRLLAAILREAGFRVLAKTTGSKPVLILPDGSEREIVRRGRPSILEQKGVLRRASRLRADAVVAEMMSIRGESLRAEANAIFRPVLLLVTNVRLDHLDDMGSTKEAIAATLAEAIPSGARVFVPENEAYPVFAATSRARGAELILVSCAAAIKAMATVPAPAAPPEAPVSCTGASTVQVPSSATVPSTADEFPDNLRLVESAAASLGIAPPVIASGLAKARLDFGSLRVWRAPAAEGRAALFLASAFAANEPESSALVLAALRRRHPGLPAKTVGLLNLRSDRGDRTLQWLRAIQDGFFDSFERLIFIGDHTRALARLARAGKLTKVPAVCLVERDPEGIMSRLRALVSEESLVVGLGNIGGPGGALVEHWSRTGASL